MKQENIDFSVENYGKLPRKNANFLQWLWFFIRPYKIPFILHSLNRFARFLFISLQPFVIGKIIDAVQSGSALVDPWAVWLWIIILGVISSIVYLMLLFGIHESKTMGKIYRGMTLYSVEHLMQLSLSWHEAEGSGGKMQRIMTARESIKRLLELYFYYYIIFAGSFAAVVVSVLLLDAPLFMIGLFIAFIASYFTVAMVMRRSLPKHYTKHNIAHENLSNKVYDYISAIRTVKTFALKPFILGRAHEGEHAGYNALIPVHVINYKMWILFNFTGLFWVLTILSLSFLSIQQGVMSIGAYAALAFLALKVWGELEGIASVMTQFYEHKNGFLRVKETLGSSKEHIDFKPFQKFPLKWGHIHLDRISFHYSKKIPVVQNVSLTIKRGKSIALIGRSGTGKSTLIKILMKQILPKNGKIFFDDINLKNIRQYDLLHHMAIVPQDVELFNGTVQENILVDQTLSKEEYKECLKKAYLEEFVRALPQKDATEIGERGIKLSGGQKQRLGIARALARRAEIILLDEATSSLDSESEHYIQKAMEASFKDKTLVIIAHRLSTIKNADWIYVLDKGKIAEEGTFKKLQSKSKIFSKLWKMQSGGFLP